MFPGGVRAPRRFPAPWGEEARLGNRGWVPAPQSIQECHLQGRNAGSSPPAAWQVLPVQPQERSTVSPRKDRTCGGCEHSPALPSRLLPGEGRPTVSPEEPGRWGVLLGASLPAASRPALLLKARIRWTGQPCWAGGLSTELRLQQADREGQRPRQGSPGAVEAGGPSCGYSADARRCFTFASEFSRCSEFSQCWGE